MRTMQQLAQEALDVQDACNLSGVVLGFGRSITELRQHLTGTPGFCTDALNQHPICKLWASKIADLSRVEYGAMAFGDAYDACRRMAAGENVAYGELVA